MVEVQIADISHKTLIANLMQLYLDDLSVYSQDQVDSDGRYDYGDFFDLYWSKDERYPYLCFLDGSIIGFAFVREIAKNEFSVAEFFLLKAYRGHGLATEFAHAVFKLHSGRWSVSQLEANVPAQRFWRKSIGQFTNGNYTEEWSDSQPRGPKQIFNSADENHKPTHAKN